MLYKETFYETLELSFPNFMKKDKKHGLTFYEAVLSKKTSLTVVRNLDAAHFFDLVPNMNLIWASILSETLLDLRIPPTWGCDSEGLRLSVAHETLFFEENGFVLGWPMFFIIFYEVYDP